MKKLIAGSIISLGVLFSLTGCESFERTKKDFQSETGGLNRSVKIINIDGKVVKEYRGKFDVEADSKRIKFVKKGKSILVYPSKTDTVLIEEN